jgi:hypothetical protein
MPSVSGKQHRLMAAVAHNPSFAKRVGIKQSVGEDFMKADKGKTFAKGGKILAGKGGSMRESKKMIEKEVAFMKAKGAPKSMVKHEEAEAKGYRTGGSVKMKETMGPRGMGMDVEGGKKAHNLPHGEHSEQKRGHTRGKELGISGPSVGIQRGMKHGGKVHKYAAGGHVGSASSRADGIAVKGKTKGRMC